MKQVLLFLPMLLTACTTNVVAPDNLTPDLALQRTVAPATDTQAEQPFTITGRVRALSSGSNVSGAVVSVSDTDIRAVSDDEGKFEFSGTFAGTYDVVASANGFEPASYSVEIQPGHTISLLIELKGTPGAGLED